MNKTILVVLCFVLMTSAYAANTFSIYGNSGWLRLNTTGKSGTFVCLEDGSYCPAALNASGTVTSVGTAGPYLTGGPITTTGTISINQSTFCLSNGTNCAGVTNGTGGSGVIQGVRSTDRYMFVVNATVVNVSLNITALTENCSVSQYSQWNGSQFICNSDNTGLTIAQIVSGTGMGIGGNNLTITQLSINTLLNLTIAQLGIVNLTPTQLGIVNVSAGFGLVFEANKLGISNSTLISTAFLENATIVRAANCTAVDNTTHISVVQNISNTGSSCVIVAKNPGSGTGGGGGTGIANFSITLMNGTGQTFTNNSQSYFQNLSGILLSYNQNGTFTWGPDITALVTKFGIGVGGNNLTLAQMDLRNESTITMPASNVSSGTFGASYGASPYNFSTTNGSVQIQPDNRVLVINSNTSANAVQIIHTGTGASSQALAVNSTNTNDTTFSVTGSPLTRALAKFVITNGTGAALSLFADNNLSQGLFFEATNSTGDRISIQNGSGTEIVEMNANGSLRITSTDPGGNDFLIERADGTDTLRVSTTSGLVRTRKLVCTTNGTCDIGDDTLQYSNLSLSGNATMNVLNARLILQGGRTVCLSNGSNCPGVSNGTGGTGDPNYGGGWTNTSGGGNVSLVNELVNVSANNIYIDNTNNKVTLVGTFIINTSGITAPNNFYIGSGAKAVGSDSTAIGRNAYTSGIESVALGYGAQVFGGNGLAIGRSTYVGVGGNSVAIGDDSSAEIAVSGYSLAIGPSSTTNNDYAICIGGFCTASGYSGIGIGDSTIAEGAYSLAFGDASEAKKDHSMALGAWTKANGTNSIVIGAGSGTGSTTLLANDKPNTLGIGLNTTLVFLINLSDGRTGIGTTAPATMLDVRGNVSVGAGTNNTGNISMAGNDLLIQPSRYVGINTTTPTATLTVRGTMNVTQAVNFGNIAASSGGKFLCIDSSGNVYTAVTSCITG